MIKEKKNMAIPTPRKESFTMKDAIGTSMIKRTGMDRGDKKMRAPTNAPEPLPPLNFMGNIQLWPIMVNTTASMGIKGCESDNLVASQTLR